MFSKKIKIFISLIIILICAISLNKIIADINTPSKEANKLKSFVEKGISYIKKTGSGKAYAEFSKSQGKFNQGELYLFVYDYDGNCLAHGSTPERVGKNFLKEEDKYGTPVIEMIIKLAKTGGGFISYYWLSPKTNTTQLKTSYVKSTNGTAIGSGLYKAIDVPKSQLIKLEELKAFVNSGIDYYKKCGAEKAFKEFENPDGKFRRGNLYMFVYNNDGVVIAHGEGVKNYVGKNLSKATDEFGTPFFQLFIQAAESGEGMVSYYWQEPISKKTKLKISYIKPLNKDSFIGAGIYED